MLTLRVCIWLQAIQGVPKLEDGLNPATWMLQISTPGMESNLGVDFNEKYRNSKLYQCVAYTSCAGPSIHSLLLFLLRLHPPHAQLAASAACTHGTLDCPTQRLICWTRKVVSSAARGCKAHLSVPCAARADERSWPNAAGRTRT